MNVHDWFRSLRHWLFHWKHHHMLELAPGEVYLRCAICGLRSPGLVIGPPRLASALPGDPERHLLVRVAMPLPVLSVEEILPWQAPTQSNRSALVH